MMVLTAMGVFILSHVLIMQTRIKPVLIKKWGRPRYLLAYSFLSIILMAWVIWELLTAPRMPIWITPLWSYYFAAIMTLISFVLLCAGALSPNPLSISFRREGFDPNRPGIIGWVRHPIIWGLSLWGIAHIPANGDWPSLILFAGAAGFGLMSLKRVETRMRVKLGEGQWKAMTISKGHIDSSAIIGACFGIVIWAFFLTVHPILFGVNPASVIFRG